MTSTFVNRAVARPGVLTADLITTSWLGKPIKSMLASTFAVSVIGMCGAALAGEASYPNRLVKIIVPASPGTGADIAARSLAQRLAETWGQGVIIENRDGASGTIGAAVAAKAPPDGYTLVMTFLATSSAMCCTPICPSISCATLSRSYAPPERRW